MMLDIFSSFDPGIRTLNQLSPLIFWLSSRIAIIIFTGTLWTTPSPNTALIFCSISVINEQSNRTRTLHIKGMPEILVALFVIIIAVNLMGLLPSVFSYTSHLIFTLRFGLPLWLALIISAIAHNPSRWAASLLPGGAPSWLNPFLVLIETIRIRVRPITLSFRLAANIRAGHIVLALIRRYGTAALFYRTWAIVCIVLIQIGYIIFEVGIRLIQAYIFCLLLRLYANDHP